MMTNEIDKDNFINLDPKFQTKDARLTNFARNKRNELGDIYNEKESDERLNSRRNQNSNQLVVVLLILLCVFMFTGQSVLVYYIVAFMKDISNILNHTLKECLNKKDYL